MVVTLSEAKSLGTMGGMLRSAQHDKPLGYFRRDVLAPPILFQREEHTNEINATGPGFVARCQSDPFR
ncbi:MAG TPA: hypothetical protein VIK33_14765, partial [Anaerolineae bacterium]